MTEVSHNTIHVFGDRIVDPTIDKDPSHWLVKSDPPPDVGVFSFTNSRIRYWSYDPPKGFTTEEIMEFEGAKDCMTLEEMKALIAERDRRGTLEINYHFEDQEGSPAQDEGESRKLDT